MSRTGSWRTFLGTEVVANPRATGFSCVFFFLGMAEYKVPNRKRSFPDSEISFQTGWQFRRQESSYRQVEFPRKIPPEVLAKKRKVYRGSDGAWKRSVGTGVNSGPI